MAEHDRSLFLDLAVRRGLISKEQHRTVSGIPAPKDGRSAPLALGQELVRRRYVDPARFVTLYDDAGLELYACDPCGARFTLAQLRRGHRCPACGIALGFDPDEVTETVSEVEILSARRLLDISLPLRPEGAARPRDESPHDLRRYRVLEEIEGGDAIATHLRAHDERTQRTVSIKVVRPGPHVSPILVARFVREGKSVARLLHPGIVKIFEIGQVRDFVFSVQEFIDGTPLRALLDHQMPVDRAVGIVGAVLDAIGYAHTKGVIHRDLGPHNIFIDREGKPHLIDFGLARDVATSGTLTKTGLLVGTPTYMAPEQFGKAHDVNARADIYSLGAVLYECLAGQPPFLGNTVLEIMQNVLESTPTPPSQLNPSVPPLLDRVVARALARDPADRYASAEELAEAIDRVFKPRSPSVEIEDDISSDEREHAGFDDDEPPSSSSGVRAPRRRRLARGRGGVGRRSSSKLRAVKKRSAALKQQQRPPSGEQPAAGTAKPASRDPDRPGSTSGSGVFRPVKRRRRSRWRR